MSTLRIIRNFAALSILLVTILAATPRAVAKKSIARRRCTPAGWECPPQWPPCCPGSVCTWAGDRAFCFNVQ
jgi:hypothetical protein